MDHARDRAGCASTHIGYGAGDGAGGWNAAAIDQSLSSNSSKLRLWSIEKPLLSVRVKQAKVPPAFNIAPKSR
ncbi:MAG TPA: hypothetical protein VK439_01780, partial [Rubrivivax sp.]|nr:hypothetical protein [Rubrivivax sp.]